MWGWSLAIQLMILGINAWFQSTKNHSKPLVWPLTHYSIQNWNFFFYFSKISIRYHNFENFLDDQKQEFNFNFLTNSSIPLYKHTSHEIVCKGMHISILIPYYKGRAYFRKAFSKKVSISHKRRVWSKKCHK